MGARLCIGVITGAQGVRGAVRVKSFTAVPEDVAAYGPLADESGARSFELRPVGRAKGVVIATIVGIADRNAAEALKGVRLHIDRAALPAAGDDEFYHADLVGLSAVLGDGTPLGRVSAVHDYGAGDSVEVALAKGGSVLVPFTRAAVPVVDVSGGRIVIDPPEGLLGEHDGSLSTPGRGPSTKAQEGPLRSDGRVSASARRSQPSPRPSPQGEREKAG